MPCCMHAEFIESFLICFRCVRNAERIIVWAASSDSTRRGHWSAIVWFPYRWGGVLTTSVPHTHHTHTHTHTHPQQRQAQTSRFSLPSPYRWEPWSPLVDNLLTLTQLWLHTPVPRLESSHTISVHTHTRSRQLAFVLETWVAPWWGVWLKPFSDGQNIHHRTGSDHHWLRRGSVGTITVLSAVFAVTFPAEKSLWHSGFWSLHCNIHIYIYIYIYIWNFISNLHTSDLFTHNSLYYILHFCYCVLCTLPIFVNYYL